MILPNTRFMCGRMIKPYPQHIFMNVGVPEELPSTVGKNSQVEMYTNGHDFLYTTKIRHVFVHVYWTTEQYHLVDVQTGLMTREHSDAATVAVGKETRATPAFFDNPVVQVIGPNGACCITIAT